MADKTKTFWLGELIGSRRVGRIGIDGKNYAIGEEIPADKLSDNRLSAFKKAGCIGVVPFCQVDGDNQELAEMTDSLESAIERIKTIEGLLEERNGVISDLKLSSLKIEDSRKEVNKAAIDTFEQIKSLEGFLAEKETEISDGKAALGLLTNFKDDLVFGNEEKSNLINDQKDEIKKLKSALKKAKKENK